LRVARYYRPAIPDATRDYEFSSKKLFNVFRMTPE
jgi:hypothetical protein